jgi:hypothetical protein
VTFLVTARGLSALNIPFEHRVFDVHFDFIDHTLTIHVNDGSSRSMALAAQSVADFYAAFMSALRSLGIHVVINTKPVESENTVPFEQDHIHASYEPQHVHRFWSILVHVNSVFQKFRSSFFGKSSPVHFFWGSFDLAETRYAGRLAPKREGADKMMRIAMDEEEYSFGFWPGSGTMKTPAFYAYTYPEPQGYREVNVLPAAAFYDPTLKEFLLKYDDVRTAASPEQAILDFLQSTYEAGATLGKWDRVRLERGVPRIHGPKKAP